MCSELRASVAELVVLGPVPTDDQAGVDPSRADRWESLIGAVHLQGAVTDAEATALVRLLSEDGSDSFGVAWALVHVVESAPAWPLWGALEQLDGPWADVLRRRAAGSAR